MLDPTVAEEAPMPLSDCGRGLKIAVLDSGVNPQHPHITARTHQIRLPGSDPSADDLLDDPIGHGTAVTAAIQEKAPGATYFAVKLFGVALRSTTQQMIQAIDWSIEQGMDIVNLSLGTSNEAHRTSLEAVVARAWTAGVLLVAARTAGSGPVLPGVLDGVIGVEVDWDLPRNACRIVKAGPDNWRCFASGYPRPLPNRPIQKNLSGISFAVANMTGVVAQVLAEQHNRTPEAICQILSARSISLSV